MTSLDRMIPTLVHIQTHLDDDLKLESLARGGWRDTEPLLPHVRRRRSASRRAPTSSACASSGRPSCSSSDRASVLEIALDSGFQSHETFTRAFGRRFGIAPSRWRQGPGSFPATADAPEERRRSLAEELPEGSLSPTTIRTLRSLPVLFQRHVGPYDEVPPTMWSRVRAAAGRRRIATKGMLLGVAHDAPELTEPARCRFDACIVVDGPAAAAWTPTNGVGAQALPGRTVRDHHLCRAV